jgi:hypothetical protein
MSEISRGGTEKARHWQEVLRAQEASGLSQAAFCRERGISAGTLAWWKRQLRRPGPAKRRMRRRTKETGAGFIEIGLGHVATPVGYEILLSRGRAVRVPGGFDARELSRLIAAVEAAPVLDDGRAGMTC